MDSAMERRHSTDSNDSSNSKQGSEVGRVAKPTAPKPPANALQFVKTGPCHLYRKAQEQITKSEQVKKEKTTVSYDSEEWQSNLDNWKSCRRKMQEHIIERVVEVKKLELEEHERSRRRSKTFSEMMQERGRKTSIPIYEDDSNDLSDLGIGSTEKNDDSPSNSDKEVFNEPDINNEEEERPLNGDASETKDLNGSLDESANNMNVTKNCDGDEYTYERAIQNYVNYAETRVKSKSVKSVEVPRSPSEGLKEAPKVAPPKPRRGSAPKVDSIFNKFDSYRKSVSTTDLTDNKKTIPVPKVDISKRRELFEKAETEDTNNKVTKKVELASSKSIKERLSFLEQQNEENRTKNVGRVDVSVKERLTTIEKKKCDSIASKPPPDLSSKSIKERLSSLERAKSTISKSASSVEPATPLRERLTSLQSACNREVSKTVVPQVDGGFHEKLSAFHDMEESTERLYPYQEEAFEKKVQRHRSLDSLDTDSGPSESFERVQSYEDLDYCRNYPASVSSDREDSGIHTADASSSVSQADDFDLHLEGGLPEDKPHKGKEVAASDRVSVPVEVGSRFAKVEACCSPPPLPAIPETPGEVPPLPSTAPPPPPLDTEGCGGRPGQPTPPPSPTPSPSSLLDPSSNSVHTQPSLNKEDFNIYEGNNEGSCSEASLSGEIPELNGELDQEKSVRLVETDDLLEEQPSKPQVVNGFLESCNENIIISTTNEIMKNMPADIQERSFPSQQKVDFPPQVMSGLVVELSMMEAVVDPIGEAVVFPLSPSSAALEPPKEKPPPPPTDTLTDDEQIDSSQNSIRRLDSTKRIKKEIRLKRSSFLGLENTDDTYTEAEVGVARPPDLTALLAEERRLDRQLAQSCSETDSNQESRDSGVELDRPPSDPWLHSRTNSDTYGNHSTTSEEDEIMKKEREIIETLEKEEQIRKQHLGEKLAMRLRELEVEKGHIEWERLQAEGRLSQPPAPPTNHHPHNNNMVCGDGYLEGEKEGMWYEGSDSEAGHQPPYLQPAVYHQQSTPYHQQPAPYHQQTPPFPQQPANYQHQPTPYHHHTNGYSHQYRNSYHEVVRSPPRVAEAPPATRRSMPDLSSAQPRRPPPPALPTKPPHLTSRPQVQPPIQQPAQQLIPQPAQPPVVVSGVGGPMSRQTLQALSAAPRPRLISSDTWQAKRKSHQPNYNYQHWLIQEAEHRRITVQQMRQQQQQQQQKLQQQQQQHHHQQHQHHQQPLPQPLPQPVQHIQHGHVQHGQHLQNVQPPQPQQRGGWGNARSPQKQHVYSTSVVPSTTHSSTNSKPLPDSIIQTLTQRVQARKPPDPNNNKTRYDSNGMLHQSSTQEPHQDRVLSVSGKKRCSACCEELGRGAAMIIESLQLFYHIDCFKCCVCCMQLGDGLNGTDVRVRNSKLHCHNCYSSDDGVKFSCV